MNLWIRFLRLLLSLGKRRAGAWDSEAALRFRVLPTDSDYFQHHLTNSRFFSFMDLARLDWLAQVGLYQPMRERGWGPVVNNHQMTYLGMIRWGRVFQVQTRAVYWDQKYLYLQHRFVESGKLRAVGTVRLVFAGKNGSVPLADMLQAAGISVPPAECPAQIKDLQAVLAHKL